jgi:alkanesulfonate monooxygenase SsuD/methylene tetrahydromethanopterin reductase-like flavin-dependent oxidoreductase (luciferase family)
MLVNQVCAFKEAKQDMGQKGRDLTLSLSRVAFLASTEAEKQERIRQAYAYYSRFDNVYTGPGLVDAGMIRPLPRTQSMEDLAKSLLICTREEMIDKLAPYAELGIDRVILSPNFGSDPERTHDALQAFSEDVMPLFTHPARIAV